MPPSTPQDLFLLVGEQLAMMLQRLLEAASGLVADPVVMIGACAAVAIVMVASVVRHHPHHHHRVAHR